jgi:hypothetical protein
MTQGDEPSDKPVSPKLAAQNPIGPAKAGAKAAREAQLAAALRQNLRRRKGDEA